MTENGSAGPTLEPYPDGTWWPMEHKVSARYPLVCRGNTGEVYPNVVSPMTASIMSLPFARGQYRLALEAGLATEKQLAGFDGSETSLAAMFAGYLYANVSMSRSAVARTPGLTVEMVDSQMFGLTGAPPHRRRPGERSPRAALRAVRTLGSAVLWPRDRVLAADREFVAAYLANAPDVATSPADVLVQMINGLAPHLERFMHDLLLASVFAGMGRSLLERVVARDGEEGPVNRLTAGLGTIESAEPAHALWVLGRLVRADEGLSAMFDGGMEGLDDRLRADPRARRFVSSFDAFRDEHGSRGPEEWELASPTWGTDPRVGLAMVDRLRHAPEDRDPIVVAGRLGQEREVLGAQVRSALPRRKRKAFDLAMRATAIYQAQREATKAAFVRLLYPSRKALAELARRAAIAHDDFFLLTIGELPAALAHPASFAAVIAERRHRRDYLQARIPPFWFEGAIPPPPTWDLRADQRRPDGRARQLHGLGVCAGVATGPARIITDPAAPGDLEPGDILVAPLTDPAWTPLFLAAAGVVVDVGAQQSHAAIVARELGIPAVVSAEGASSTIPDGALITVDGTTGIVTVHGAR